MIADTNGRYAAVTYENEIGIQETHRMLVTYCVRQPDGSVFLHTKDGNEYTFKSHNFKIVEER